MMAVSSMTAAVEYAPTSPRRGEGLADDDDRATDDFEDYVDHYRYYYRDDDEANEKGPAEEESGGGEEEAAETPLERLMDRGRRLRLLRQLALDDECERMRQRCEEEEERRYRRSSSSSSSSAGYNFHEEKKEEGGDVGGDDDCDCNYDCHRASSSSSSSSSNGGEDVVRTLPGTNETVLDYDSYLSHQRYYDDLKHVDHNYIDYTLDDYGDASSSSSSSSSSNGGGGGVPGRRHLVVEQRKRLGKGGLCWDAAFVLGEHVASDAAEWRNDDDDDDDDKRPARVLELGAGTGLCGLMVASMVPDCTVELTDLPELQDLLISNVERNFGTSSSLSSRNAAAADASTTATTTTGGGGGGRSVSCRVLRWGVESDFAGAPYDVVIGADVVTSLYDPVALARTFHALSGPGTRVYVSGKTRLVGPHDAFEGEMSRLFGSVRGVDGGPRSRLRSPGVFVIVACGKR